MAEVVTMKMARRRFAIIISEFLTIKKQEAVGPIAYLNTEIQHSHSNKDEINYLIHYTYIAMKLQANDESAWDSMPMSVVEKTEKQYPKLTKLIKDKIKWLYTSNKKI